MVDKGNENDLIETIHSSLMAKILAKLHKDQK